MQLLFLIVRGKDSNYNIYITNFQLSASPLPPKAHSRACNHCPVEFHPLTYKVETTEVKSILNSNLIFSNEGQTLWSIMFM